MTLYPEASAAWKPQSKARLSGFISHMAALELPWSHPAAAQSIPLQVLVLFFCELLLQRAHLANILETKGD